MIKQYRPYFLLGPFGLVVLTVAGMIILVIQKGTYDQTVIAATATTIECDGAGLSTDKGKYPNTSPEKPKLILHCDGKKMTLEDPATVIAFALHPRPRVKCRKHMLGIDNCVVE